MFRIENLMVSITPLVEMDHNIKGLKVYAKLEGHNVTGSAKYRFGLYVAKKLNATDKVIIESTAGTSGITLAYFANLLGLNSEFAVAEHADNKIVAKIEEYGGKVHRLPLNEGLDLMLDLSQKEGYFWPRQYFDITLSESYHSLAEEIHAQLAKKNIHHLDSLVAAIGTGLTAIGTSRKLIEKFAQIKTIAVYAKQGAIPGIRPKKIMPPYCGLTDILSNFSFDHDIEVDECQAQVAVNILARNKIKSGLSGAAALYALLSHYNQLDKNDEKTAVVILPDASLI